MLGCIIIDESLWNGHCKLYCMYSSNLDILLLQIFSFRAFLPMHRCAFCKIYIVHIFILGISHHSHHSIQCILLMQAFHSEYSQHRWFHSSHSWLRSYSVSNWFQLVSSAILLLYPPQRLYSRGLTLIGVLLTLAVGYDFFSDWNIKEPAMCVWFSIRFSFFLLYSVQ